MYTFIVTMKKCNELGDTPDSPDLAPDDYFLLPNRKNWLDGKNFGSNDEVIGEKNKTEEKVELSVIMLKNKKSKNVFLFEAVVFHRESKTAILIV